MHPAVFLPIAFVVVIFLARMTELGAKRGTVKGRIREGFTLWLFVATGALMFGCGIAEFLLLKRVLFWPATIVGAFCAIFSFVLRRRAIAALGRFWSLHVEIREEHEFIQTGPFRWMRHPTYFSMVLELLSVPLILNAWYSLLVIPIFFVPVLLWRIHIEEAALVQKFGDAYRLYQKTTPALFPGKRPPSA